MIENITNTLTKAEQDEHVKTWGGFNDAPPNLTEITAEEFAQSGFFTWCKEKMEFRQIDPAQINKSNLLSPMTCFHSFYLFFLNHGNHYAMTNDYWGKKVRYFKFFLCDHNYQEISAQEAGKPAWNCYHYTKCTKCGDLWEYDSSG